MTWNTISERGASLSPPWQVSLLASALGRKQQFTLHKPGHKTQLGQRPRMRRAGQRVDLIFRMNGTPGGYRCDRINWEFYELGFIVLLSNWEWALHNKTWIIVNVRTLLDKHCTLMLNLLIGNKIWLILLRRRLFMLRIMRTICSLFFFFLWTIRCHKDHKSNIR